MSWWRRRRPDPGPDAALQRQLDILRATDAERQRIYDDLHDDVGAKLLTLLHEVPEAQQDLVREVIQDIRDILARGRGPGGSLTDVLGLLREETARRLELHDISLDWSQPGDLPAPRLAPHQAMHLFRIGREAVTNALRHARPRQLRVRVDQVGDDLVFEIGDDGRFDPQRIGTGRGTQAMRNRAGELQGDIAWLPGSLGGTKVRLRFPLPPASEGWAAAGPAAKLDP